MLLLQSATTVSDGATRLVAAIKDILTFALLGAGEPSLGVGLRLKLLPLPFGDLVRDRDLDLSSGV